MTDDFDVDAHDDIRNLLADARLDAPIPADVAARLDATLADLVSRETTAVVARVIPLRRRLAPRLLIAAAAVVVVGGIGVGLGEVLGGTTSETAVSADSGVAGDSAGSADGKSESLDTVSPSAAAAEKGEALDADLGTPNNLPGSVGGDGSTRYSAADLPTFTTSDFDDQARTHVEVQALRETNRRPVAPQTGATVAPQNDATRGTGCALPATITEADELSPITLDGSPAVLVVHPEAEGAQLVEALDCGTGAMLASTTVER